MTADKRTTTTKISQTIRTRKGNRFVGAKNRQEGDTRKLCGRVYKRDGVGMETETDRRREGWKVVIIVKTRI